MKKVIYTANSDNIFNNYLYENIRRLQNRTLHTGSVWVQDWPKPGNVTFLNSFSDIFLITSIGACQITSEIFLTLTRPAPFRVQAEQFCKLCISPFYSKKCVFVLLNNLSLKLFNKTKTHFSSFAAAILKFLGQLQQSRNILISRQGSEHFQDDDSSKFGLSYQ